MDNQRSILIRKDNRDFSGIMINVGTVQVNNANEEIELIGFLKAAIEAYQDWRINGDE